MPAPPPELSVQALIIVGGVAGGAFAVLNGVIKLLRDLIPHRKNGNGHRDFAMLHEDIREIDADIKSCSSTMTELHRAADGFSNSHVMLKELLTEIVVGNRAYHQQFSIFLEQFSSHMRDFRCLGLAQSDTEDDK